MGAHNFGFVFPIRVATKSKIFATFGKFWRIAPAGMGNFGEFWETAEREVLAKDAKEDTMEFFPGFYCVAFLTLHLCMRGARASPSLPARCAFVKTNAQRLNAKRRIAEERSRKNYGRRGFSPAGALRFPQDKCAARAAMASLRGRLPACAGSCRGEFVFADRVLT